DGAPRLMVDASVSYGASGGGVYSAETGELVGIIEGYRTARVSFQVDNHPGQIDVPVPGETYVVSLAQIRRFLGETGHADLLGARVTDWRRAARRPSRSSRRPPPPRWRRPRETCLRPTPARRPRPPPTAPAPARPPPRPISPP